MLDCHPVPAVFGTARALSSSQKSNARSKDENQPREAQVMFASTLIMCVGAVIALSAVFAGIRPMTKGNPYYV